MVYRHIWLGLLQVESWISFDLGQSLLPFLVALEKKDEGEGGQKTFQEASQSPMWRALQRGAHPVRPKQDAWQLLEVTFMGSFLEG